MYLIICTKTLDGEIVQFKIKKITTMSKVTVSTDYRNLYNMVFEAI